MIGIVIATHSQLGDALIDTAEFIIGKRPETTVSVSMNLHEDVDKLREKMVKGIKAVNQNAGVLILTDMFGGTPSNLSYSFLEEGRVEVISGVNLPMLVKALDSREKTELSQLAAELEAFGKKSISLASGILKGNKQK
ncbi:MAG: PTS sugar transporter subunit IIA [Pseudomonadota bacterium]|uniref:PTS sugar transporter subunit IIA n=1 Tax=Candidatus Desulfatibia profunda TaxID=2841695 RepID=A0A8J6NTI4_9BACT|nr:PTS sugar transporter subunit IIA [Candidatus Desulfatibia profunda]MBL7180847.1 PTS sugar transporter subunit IIA [Desulfobacterales bacterium]